MNQNGTFSIDDFFRLATIKQEEFEIIEIYPNLITIKSDPNTQISVYEDTGKNILEQYGVIYFLEFIVMVHQQIDMISICLKTIQLLLYLSKDSELKSKNNSLLLLVTNYINLTRVLGKIEEKGLTTANRRLLVQTLFKIFVLNPTTKDSGIFTKLFANFLFSNKFHNTVSGIYTGIKNKLIAKI